MIEHIYQYLCNYVFTNEVQDVDDTTYCTHIHTCKYMYIHVRIHVCKHVFTNDLDDEQRIVHIQIHVCTYICKNTYTDDFNDTYKCD